MKIALITNSFNSPTELWIWRQVGYMGENIGYIGILEEIEEQKGVGIPVVSLVSRNRQTAINPFFLLRRLMELEEKFEIDAYYVHYLTNAYVLKEFISWTDKKVFVHCHGYDITVDMKQHQNPDSLYHSPGYLAFTSSLPLNISYLTDSEHAKSILVSCGVSARQVSVLHFGVPVEGMNLRKVNDPIKVLYLGRLVDFKGPDLTIQAFDRACADGLNARLLIVGDGPLMITCQLLKSRSRFSDRIIFLGTLPYLSAKKLREECHIFTAHNIKGPLTNQQEAYGVSIVEAMGAGLPVVTGRNGGVSETVVHNRTGFLFEPGDIEAHARYLNLLASNHEQRENMGRRALKHITENFSLEKEKESLAKILQFTESKSNNLQYATIIGPYRFHNFGDDLIGAIIAKHLQSKNFNVHIPLFGKANADWLGLEYCNGAEDSIMKSDVIIIGGGGILGDAGITPDDYYRELALQAASRGSNMRKRVITTGVGAGPLALEKSKALTLQIASLSERIGIRDVDSKIFLEKLGVNSNKLVEGADLALLCDKYLKFNKEPSNKIGLQFDIVRFTDIIENNPAIKDIFIAVMRYVSRNNSNIILLSNGYFRSQLDISSRNMCETLCYNELELFLPKLAGLRAIFTSHLHLAITAYSQRIPCFSLYVREKTKRFYSQIGHPERAIDLNIATTEDFNRLIKMAEESSWTTFDEEILIKLRKDASKLLEII